MINFQDALAAGHRICVRYAHINLGRLPLEIHVNGDWILTDITDADGLAADVARRAQDAPAEAEWFEYMCQRQPGVPVFTPFNDVPDYFLDTTPTQGPTPTIQLVALRRSGMRMPFYPEQPHRNAVISTRG